MSYVRLFVDTHNHQKTSFEYRVNQTKFTDVELVQAHSIIEDDIKLFNGVLFDKSVIEHFRRSTPRVFLFGVMSKSLKAVFCKLVIKWRC